MVRRGCGTRSGTRDIVAEEVKERKKIRVTEVKRKKE